MEVLCNFCDEAAAAFFCHDCNMHFCTANGCDDQIHAGRRHKKEALHGSTSAAAHEEEAPVCEFCELSPSELYCEDCCMYLCTANGCLASVHKNAVGHEITSLFMDDGVSEYDEEQEGPSELRSQCSETDIEPELSQLSLSRTRSPSDRKPEPAREPPKPPPPAPPKVSPVDLPRSLGAPLSAKPSPVKLAAKSAPPAASPPARPSTNSASKIVSKVVKRLVAPIRGTGTKEERLQRKETILAARAEPEKLPYSTFGTKFAPEDAKGRRKPSLSFLKQPSRSSSSAPPTTLSSPPVSIAPRPARSPAPESKRGTDIVITSVTTIRTTTTIRTEGPKPKPPTPTTRGHSLSTSSGTPQVAARGADVPSSLGRLSEHASPAASLPSSLFSPSSALPSPTASVRSNRRPSLVNPPQPSPPARLSSCSSSSSSSGTSMPRRSSTILSPSLAAAETDFEYPTGLAPLGLKYVNAPEAGILVRAVTPGEAGEKAGIQIGDIVKLLNRKAVRNMGEFQAILCDCKPTVVYKMAVVRKDKSVDLKLVL